MEKREELLNLLYGQYGMVRQYLFAYNLTKEEREDILQETMVIAWQKYGTLRDKSKVEPWLRAIAKNQVRTYFRKQGSFRKKLYKMLERFTAIDEVHHPTGLPDGAAAEIMDGFTDPEIYEMVMELGEPDSTILRLYYGYEETFDEIAKTLGMNPNTVRSIAMRSRTKLKFKMEEEEKWNRNRSLR